MVRTQINKEKHTSKLQYAPKKYWIEKNRQNLTKSFAFQGLAVHKEIHQQYITSTYTEADTD